MNRQVRELDEGTLHRMSLVAQVTMGEHHARWGGSPKVAHERGTAAYRMGFAEERFSMMQTATPEILGAGQKERIKRMLENENYDLALVHMAAYTGEL